MSRVRRCRECDEPFNVSREWQLFCGPKCQQRWNYTTWRFCFYCGEASQTRDHLHPVAARGFKRMFDGQETVRACTECNSTLGAALFCSIEHRVAYLRNRYIKKYKLDRGAVEWDHDEIIDLGRNLRSHVKKSLAERHLAERRVCYAQGVFYRLVMLNEDGALTDEVRNPDETPIDPTPYRKYAAREVARMQAKADKPHKVSAIP